MRIEDGRAERKSGSGGSAPRRTRRTVHFLLVFVASVLIVDSLIGERGLLETMRARKQYQELAASITAVRRDNARLREQARRLREERSAIEEIARRDLGLIKPGETLFIVKDVASPSPQVK